MASLVAAYKAFSRDMPRKHTTQISNVCVNEREGEQKSEHEKAEGTGTKYICMYLYFTLSRVRIVKFQSKRIFGKKQKSTALHDLDVV